jgi:hypothetical protein
VPGGTARNQPLQIELGAYLGAVFPITRNLRLRSQLGVRVVAARFGEATDGVAFPRLPGWDGSLSLGVEGALP